MQFHNKRPDSVFKAIMRALSGLRWLVVAFITTLVTSIILLGAVFVLPATCESLGFWFLALNHLITWALSFNVFWNYFSAIFNTPGSVRECLREPFAPGQEMPPRCFDNYRYCEKCKWYKPPTAHHCSICKTCVVEMDHHVSLYHPRSLFLDLDLDLLLSPQCPFINNCVGKANLRSFILFLSWTIAANLFCISHCLYLLFFLRNAEFFQGLGSVLNRITGINVLLVTVFTFVEMPGTCLVAVFILSFSLGMLVSIGSLLFLQIRHISSLPPLLPTNDRHGAPILNSRALAQLTAHLNKIMGGTTVSAYLYPVWGPPPGCLAADKKSM